MQEGEDSNSSETGDADRTQMNYSIIIPVLNPDSKTTDFVDALINAGLGHIVVVDDGSKEETQKYFKEISEKPGCTVLVHEVNRGKGAALKTAFKYLHDECPDIDAAITADGDGQHNIDCINACIKSYEEAPQSVIFGGRDFDVANIPARSRFGNKISSVVYRFACGIKLNDTQTGLRIIPKACFEKFSTLKGDRYEYETNMIMNIASDHIPYKEVPIETIYINENETSHFNPIKDSAKIYVVVLKNVFKFLLNSGICWVVDEGLAWLFLSVILMGASLSLGTRTMLSMLFARIISSLLNFALNRRTVFRSTESVFKTAVRYYILAACILAISICLVELFAVKLLGIDGLPLILIKCIVDIVLFLASYTVQRKWVFKEKKTEGKLQS